MWAAIGYEGPASTAEASTAARREEFVFPMINSEISNDVSLTVDAVVVGSGCGGSVVAAELAQAGRRVLVLEKGQYFQRKDMTSQEGDAFEHMYERGGLVTTDDTGIGVLAGATFGGGSTINWACSLRTPDHVKNEWASQHGLKAFADGTFDASLDAVCSRLDVKSNGVTHNVNNQILIDGCNKLGYQIDVAPQNMADVGPFPEGGFISNGDRYGNKQSTPETYLKDAATASVPAKFADRCHVEYVMHQGGVAKGVRARIVGADGVTEHVLTVNAPIVVVSCGSLNSPALLLRSSLPDSHRQIGKNLRLHPVTGVLGIMPDEVNLWRGAPMTTVSNQCGVGAKDNYFAKLECPIAHPGIFSAIAPWKDGASFKDMMLEYKKSAAIIVLTRDKGSGQVTVDKTGMARLSYKVDDHDRMSLLEGAEKALRILEAAGAAKISVGQFNAPIPLPPQSDPEGRAAAIEKIIADVRRIGFPLYKVPLYSAHQMGSCKMGTDPRTSVVKPTCETWACSGLYVVDASTFPTSSGVNPMITTLSIAHMAAQGLKKANGAPMSRL
jgi:choline dehydrogenase-like flavoprotein